MRKILKTYLDYIENNTLFGKTLLSYTVIGGIIFAVFSVVIISSILYAFTDQMSSQDQRMLSQSCNTGDLVLYDIHSSIYQQFDNNAVLREAMYSPASHTNTLNINKTMNDVVSSNSLIDSVYILNFEHNIIFSSKSVASSFEQFFDQGIVKTAIENRGKVLTYFPRKAKISPFPGQNGDANYITSIYSVSENGMLVINIDQQRFQSMVSLKSNNISHETIVLSRFGNVLAHSDDSYFSQNMTNDDLLNQIILSPKRTSQIRQDNKIINYVKSEILSHTYISILDLSYMPGSFGSLLTIIIIFLVILLLFYFFAGILITVSTYKPFYKIQGMINSFFKKPENSRASSGFEDISNTLAEIKRQYNSMQTIEHRYALTIQSEIINKLLNGTFSYSQENLIEYDIVFEFKNFTVILARIDNIANVESASIPVIKYAVMNVGTELFEKTSKVYTTEVNENDVAFLLNHKDNDFNTNDILQLKNYINDIFGITITISSDSKTCTVEDTSDLYNNAHRALIYRFVKRYNSYIPYEDIKQILSTTCKYPAQLEHNILEHIKALNADLAKNDVSAFISSIKNVSYNTLLLHSNRLILAIDQFIGEIGTYDDINTDIIKILSGIETIDDLAGYINQKCEDAINALSDIKSGLKKDNISSEIIEYIESNYKDPNLSIHMISKHINRSTNYARSIFKQNQGITISDYITKKRFDEVCRLLIETNLPALKTGEMVGLNSSSYFYTSFKKYTGYTPEEYRLIHKRSKA